MKKTALMIAGAIALGMALVPAGKVSADAPTATADTPAVSTSTGQFSVAAGALTLDSVPDIDFGTPTMAQFIAGATLKSTTAPVTTAATDATANNGGTLSVTDARGGQAGWSLNAKSGDFVTGTQTTVKITPDTLTLNPTAMTISSTATMAGGNIQVNSEKGTTGADIWTAAQGTGSGLNTATFNAGAATLVLPAQSNASEGTYLAPITWTLSATPAAN
ncbi:WxL domain-containing protein [Lacticaseibacillus pabuli]|uniref:WxL domain-containing protein n=1 Tax=Lacticaseibacillus pabuli TaxID=3025672 RepID=A0ABY7WNE9_9LACO|nr:WxL domain-containing protein [Lacticaseibacillus sp. KACC 23028]WDF81732.1 WxL domain-containing protein [Lacticaseibacillus sp. KACC 23028]